MSLRDFAGHLGVSERTVSKWEAGQGNVHPRPEMQAALDTALKRTDQAALERFSAVVDLASQLPTPPGALEPGGLAALARKEISAARQTLSLTAGAFAEVLAPILRWKPSQEMIESWETDSTPPGDVLVAAQLLAKRTYDTQGRSAQDRGPVGVDGATYADVTAVHPSRAEFAAHLPAEKLLAGARDIRAVGLSLNLLCQDYSDHRWIDLMESGARARCLFLDPDGSAIRARETEEGFPAGSLAALTRVNIETLRRTRERLHEDLQSRFEIALYDDIPRFNILIVDDLCVVQPYLPRSRGINSPTLTIRRQTPVGGLYAVFEQLVQAQREGGHRL